LGWTILLGVTILVLTLLYWIIQQRRDQPPPGIKQLPAFPGICWPLIGQLPTVMQWPSNGQHHAIEKVINETKESSLLLRVPGITAVLTVDPEYVRHITATKFGTIYEKGEVMHRMFYDFLGNGIFNVNGEEWQRHRRLAQNLFHKKSLEAHVPVFIRAAERVADRLVALSKEKEYEQNGLDIQDFCMRATLDSFAEIGFGVALNSIDEERNEFAIAFDKVQTKTQLRNRQGELWPLIETIFPDRDFRQRLDYLNTLVHQIIASRKTQSLEEVQQSTDALSAMLAQGVDYSDEELRDFVMNFLLAGRDTTSTLLTWTFYYLSLHPEVERKMVEEIQSVIGEEELTYENIKGLKYMKQVFQETMRLRPPVPFDGYFAREDDVLPGGFQIKKGWVVLYITYVMHRREALFENPEEFRPERFDTVPTGGREDNQHPAAYVPFHYGPRTCMGREMAYEEARIFMCTIFRRGLRFRLHPGFEPELHPAIILTSENGMRMDLVPPSS